MGWLEGAITNAPVAVIVETNQIEAMHHKKA
jgi:hypothetical protein